MMMMMMMMMMNNNINNNNDNDNNTADKNGSCLFCQELLMIRTSHAQVTLVRMTMQGSVDREKIVFIELAAWEVNERNCLNCYRSFRNNVCTLAIRGIKIEASRPVHLKSYFCSTAALPYTQNIPVQHILWK